MALAQTLESLDFDAVRNGDMKTTGDIVEFLWKALNEEARQRRRGVQLVADRAEWATHVESPSASVDDYDIAQASVLRFDGASAVDLTGLLAPSGGAARLVIVLVLGSATITLKHESASSEAPNRILTFSAGDLAVATNQAVLLHYQNSRWRELKLA